MYEELFINACCPFKDCHESLLSDRHIIGGKPTVHLIVEKGGKRGDIYLSSHYDDFRTVEPETPHILIGDVLKFFCPHCGKELPFAETCACKAPMVYMGVEDNGRIRICTRKGCHYHSLEFGNSGKLKAFIEKSGKRT